MEAFILADRVVTAQHIPRSDAHDPKYLKRCGLHTRSCNMTPKPKSQWAQRDKSQPRNSPVTLRKVKNLLSTLGNGLIRWPTNSRSFKEARITKFFSTSPEKLSPEKKLKSGLLVRKVIPRGQQYDANIAAIAHKAPSWTFYPHNRQIGNVKYNNLVSEPSSSQKKRTKTPQRKKEKIGAPNRASDSEEYVLDREQQKIYEEMRERSGFGEYQQECKMQYSPQDLGKCAIEIFKKYELDKHAYFKKFVAEIQQMG